MGNGNGGGGGGRDNGPDRNGMYEHCYNVGFDHSSKGGGDPIGEGIDAAPCTITQSGQAGYAAGYDDGRGNKREQTNREQSKPISRDFIGGTNECRNRNRDNCPRR